MREEDQKKGPDPFILPLSFPNGISFFSFKEKNKNSKEGLIPYERNPGTFRYWSYYTQKEFEDILKSVGFKLIKSMKHNEKEKDGATTVWLCFFAKK